MTNPKEHHFKESFFLFQISNDVDGETFLLKHGLYDSCEICIPIKEPSDEIVSRASGGASFHPKVEVTLDSYCTNCEKDSVFKTELLYGGYLMTFLKTNSLSYRCTRCQSENLRFYFEVKPGSPQTIQKIGQYPSLATLSQHTAMKYKCVLQEPNFAEFKRAIGLNAHGIGVGAFVYLRRIFERLICKFRDEAVAAQDLVEADFKELHMDKKIKALKGYVPDFVYEQRNTLYGILSKGVHADTEKKCLANFPSLKSAIEVILEEMIQKKEMREKLKAATKAIEAINQSKEN